MSNRADALGMFWQDVKVVKEKKAPAPKRTPPEPVWLKDDYLPYLEEARSFIIPEFTDVELVQAAQKREKLVWDIESYRNYFLVAFKSLDSGKIVYFEDDEQLNSINYPKLKWLVENFEIIGFNSNTYDFPILVLCLSGLSNSQLKWATNQIISENTRPADLYKHFKIKNNLVVNHIDLIEVSPLFASLKIYGGRMHCPKMQDLPFHPEALLSPEQMDITRFYCFNDLKNTELLFNQLKEEIELRRVMSVEYKMDLRSRSDAQIAESVIGKELTAATGRRPTVPVIEPGTAYAYAVPHYLNFQTPLMQWVLNEVRKSKFIVGDSGAVGMPPELKNMKINIANSTYTMGIGGLHSTESVISYQSNDDMIIIDRDVASYYPRIILNQGLYPHHLTKTFLSVYGSIVERRLKAKATGQKVIADSLKITINGGYGKFGNKYSILYSPSLIIQVTLTGQLSLLLLIERLELSGINVVSANTDGIVVYVNRKREGELNAIIAQWERDTGFETEETRYKSYYGRDVNNYIAIKEDGKVKDKGAFANPWKGKYSSLVLHYNPSTTICLDAIQELLTNNVPISHTIRNSRDISKFVSVRTVNGGAVKDGEYLGKAIRWYYSRDINGEIVYAKNGNKVPKSDGARPCMEFPEEFPTDIDYDWYERETLKMLESIGYETV